MDEHRKYHNKKVYWNFGSFVAAYTAFVSGVASVLIDEKLREDNVVQAMLNLGAWIIVVAGVLCALNVISHFRAKVKNEKKPLEKKRLFLASDMYIVYGTVTLVCILCIPIISGAIFSA